jgi:hypothetical protein
MQTTWILGLGVFLATALDSLFAQESKNPLIERESLHFAGWGPDEMSGNLQADQPSKKLAAPIDKGQHVLILGNSFQVFVDHHLNVMAGAAGIKGHVRGGDPLAAVKVDVVAANPWFRIHDKFDTLIREAAT